MLKSHTRWLPLLLLSGLMAVFIAPPSIFGGPPPGKGGGGGEEPALFGIIDLGGFAGGDDVQSWAFGLNNPDASACLQIVGDSYLPDGSRHPILWEIGASGELLGQADLGLLPPATHGSALMINDGGLIAGRDDAGHGWFVASGVPMTALPTFGGPYAEPQGMSNVGDIVGVARDPDTQQGRFGELRNALWHVDSAGNVVGPIDLGTFHALDVNDDAVMVGVEEENGLATVAWFDDQLTLQRQSIGLLNPDDVVSIGWKINNAGEVAGTSKDSNGRTRGFFWSPLGGMAALGDFGGGESHPLALNNRGQVVGWATTRKGDRQAFVWENATLIDLAAVSESDSNWRLIQAEGINDTGHIVGLGHVGGRKGERHGFLLAPLP